MIYFSRKRRRLRAKSTLRSFFAPFLVSRHGSQCPGHKVPFVIQRPRLRVAILVSYSVMKGDFSLQPLFLPLFVNNGMKRHDHAIKTGLEASGCILAPSGSLYKQNKRRCRRRAGARSIKRVASGTRDSQPGLSPEQQVNDSSDTSATTKESDRFVFKFTYTITSKLSSFWLASCNF